MTEQFMRQVVDQEPGDCLITDATTLRDGTFPGIADTTPIWAKIIALYGLGGSQAGSECMIHAFASIKRRGADN